MGKSSSKERRDKIVKISLGSPKETNSPAGDAKYKGKTPRAPQNSFQEQTDFPNIPTVHSNRLGSPKETNSPAGDAKYKGKTPRAPQNSFQEQTDFPNIPTVHSNSFSISKSTNGTLQTITRVTELSTIDNDTGGNDITDQLDSGSVSHNKSDTASYPSVQTAKSENDEQTIPMTNEDKKETKKEKKKKKKKRCITPVKQEASEPMQTGCWLPQEENTGAKNKMRPSKPMKAGTTVDLLKQDETDVKDKMSVSEQQVKTMTMEAERLAEQCRFNIEMSKTDDEELILCPKAFIQSISSVEKHISNLECKNSNLVMEKNEYLNRLSSAAAARLIDNNSNITNLNDPNRPMKLADKFNKIYDDEWTDMIEKLEKKGPKTEKHKDKCVYHLYSIPIVIFNSLSKKAEVQLQGMAEHLFLLTKPSTEQIEATWYDYKEERVQLIASRKKIAETTILMLHRTLQTDTIFLQELCECSPPLDDVMLSDILHSEYFMKCVEICWHFVIQDPPMYVENVSLKGRKIDKDTHKVYTKSGDIVKYHVWPALYLHHQDGTNSPLMGKGVVQPE